MTHQLLEVPSADLHVALVLVQTLCERLGIILATSRAPLVILVAVVVGLACDCVVGLFGWGGGSATEHAADGVADGGTNCYTAVVVSVHAI